MKLYRVALSKILLQQSTCDPNMSTVDSWKKTKEEKLLSFSFRTDHFHAKVASSTLHLTPIPQFTN